jgi:acyl-coenzyme A synthetase/AMP-(fatty) acid ligase
VHLAAFRSGCISVPLFTLFGEDALEFRLTNSEAKALVTDEGGLEKLARIQARQRDTVAHIDASDDQLKRVEMMFKQLEQRRAQLAHVGDRGALDVVFRLLGQRAAEARLPGEDPLVAGRVRADA